MLSYYHVICLERLTKTTKNLSQDGQSPDRDLNLRPPEYEDVLTSQPGRAVISEER
jgi:hypothetical protein